MRFLVDEMFSPHVAELLRDAGHDARHVSEIGLAAAEDVRILDLVVAQRRVVLTENAIDFVPLLDERTAAGASVTPVLIALKRNLPRAAGVLATELAERVGKWAERNPDPYHHVHWLG